MIWDCFTFFNEEDLLEIRLNELDSIVDKFVICESTYTHAGNYKGLNFNINKYPGFKDKIIYLVDDNLPYKTQIDLTKHLKGSGSGPAWENENHQRDFIKQALTSMKDSDYIIVSDLDEIPSLEGVKFAINQLSSFKDHYVIFSHKTYYYWVNYYALEAWGSKIMSGYKFRTKFGSSPQKVRSTWSGTDVIYMSFGWHFGWLGGKDRIIYKFNEFAHQEYKKENRITGIVNNINNMVDMWDRKLYKIPMNDSFPSHLFKNQEKFSYFIAK